MRETNVNNANIGVLTGVMPLCVDTEMLQVLLSCGHKTATEIGENAEAKLYVGKRVLWSTEKIKEYVYNNSIGI